MICYRYPGNGRQAAWRNRGICVRQAVCSSSAHRNNEGCKNGGVRSLGGGSPTPTPPPPPPPPTPSAGGLCRIKDPNWTCKGSKCMTGNNRQNVDGLRFRNGETYCLTSSARTCTRTDLDKSWCSNQCKCPFNCPHACGRCPAKGSSPAVTPRPTPRPTPTPTPPPPRPTPPPTPRPTPPTPTPTPSAGGLCRIKDPNWTCKGSKCMTGGN